ncbi:kinase-like protein [Rhizophagus irregularis]|uniref:Kinase-like protein n=1 Tax=Rhizophagus irregularis TaxID=588596 RepID=A0A2N1N2M4_9GLOM|nr:kinase-like protein [Rhizophagus irregularis]
MPYIAPEVIRGLGNTKAADIYSFGIIMWEILTGERPYKDQPHDIHLAFKILDGLRPTIPEGTPDNYRNLMQKCWHKNLTERAKNIKNEVMSLRNSLDLDLKHLRGPVGNNGKDLSFSTLSIHPEACYVSKHLPLDELRGEFCQHPEWPGKGWDLLKKEPTVKNETQHKYISREYDLSLDIEFLIKNDGSFIDRAIRLSPKRSKS